MVAVKSALPFSSCGTFWHSLSLHRRCCRLQFLMALLIVIVIVTAVALTGRCGHSRSRSPRSRHLAPLSLFIIHAGSIAVVFP